MTADRRRIPKPLFWVGLLGGGLLAGLGIAWAMNVSALLGGALTLVFFAVLYGMTVRHWRSLDEVSREAHKAAWYWGGPIAVALGTLVLAFAPRPAALFGEHAATPDDALVTGFLFCLLCQLAGYLVTWAGWWLAKGVSFGKEG